MSTSTWLKPATKVILSVLGVVLVWAACQALINFGDHRAMDRVRAAPADTVVVVKERTVYLHDTTFVPIWGTVRDTIDLSFLTRSQLEEAAQPFSFSKQITVTDDKEKVSVAFNLSLTARPTEHSVTGLTFSNIRSTYPEKTVTITKNIVEPYRQHPIDFFLATQVGGLWNRRFGHDLAASFELGMKLNIGQCSISFAPGFASMQSKGYAYYVARLEWSTR